MDNRIALLRKRLLSDLPREWTIEEMARLARLAPSQLHNLFKSNTGMSPIQFLRDLRLETARGLLENSFEQVKEIRRQVGIFDAAHFARDFKAKYGAAPSEYRRKAWKENDRNEN